MLKYFKDKNLVNYTSLKPASWEEAIYESCRKLKENGYITDQYIEEIIASVKEHGPYIVIVPQVAMPHAQATSEGVLGTAISFTKFKEPVVFYDQEFDEDKPATLFFTLAAKNPDEHLGNITNLMALLGEEGMIEKLLETQTLEDFEQLLEA